jgi:L-iditol 2-dehydrogenase
MRVARYDMVDPGFPVSLAEIDDPALPGPAWSRISVRFGGICGSDLHNVFPDGTGSRIFGPFVGFPMEMGHEVCGVVVEAGPDAAFPPGTRVAVDPTVACAARGLELCAMCAAGAPSSCHRLGSRVLTDGFGHGFTTGLGGGWGDQLVAHASQLHAVPDAVDDRTAVLAEPLSVAVHAILRRPPTDGPPVLVIGAGIIGLTCVAALRQLVPASEVPVLARHPHQQAAAQALGAHHVLVPDDGHAYLEALAALGGGTLVGRKDAAVLSGGFGAVVEAVGTGASVGQAVRFVAQRGVVHFVGCAGITQVDLAAAWFKEVEIVGTFCHAVDEHHGERAHSFDRALAMLERAALPADTVVTHTFPLEEVRAACETARDKRTGAIKVVLEP